MGKRLAIIKRIGMSVKKVVGSRHCFIAGRRIKMAYLDVEAIANRKIGFSISLGERNTVAAGRRTAQIEIPISPVKRLAGIHIEWRYTESLGINRVGAKHEIKTAA